MGIIQNIARWAKGMITNDAQKNFEVTNIISRKMEKEIEALRQENAQLTKRLDDIEQKMSKQ